MRDVRVAAVQFESVQGDKRANLEKIAWFADQAAQRGVEMAVFPECCITGYWFLRKLSRDELALLAEPVFTGPSSLRLAELARGHGLTIGAGLVEAGEDGRFYNTYVVAMPDGRMHRWWTADDATRFDAAAEPIVRQFSQYEPLPGLRVDGRLTRTENVADLAGLTAAFEAYRRSLGVNAADRESVRRQDREFFIAFAQAFGAKMNDAGMRAQLKTDHAPEMYRMDTVRNLDAWYDAFDVVPGQRLYLAPRDRVRVW